MPLAICKTAWCDVPGHLFIFYIIWHLSCKERLNYSLKNWLKRVTRLKSLNCNLQSAVCWELPRDHASNISCFFDLIFTPFVDNWRNEHRFEIWMCIYKKKWGTWIKWKCNEKIKQWILQLTYCMCLTRYECRWRVYCVRVHVFWCVPWCVIPDPYTLCKKWTIEL